MEVSGWDIQEVKRLKKKRLVRSNIMMLILCVMLIYYIQADGSAVVLLGFCSVVIWLLIVQMLYSLKTGKTIGTKTNRLIQAFDKDHKGEKRWKRRIMTEAVILGSANLLLTILLFMFDFGSADLRFSTTAFPVIGSWIGYNIGEGVRIRSLGESNN